MSYVTRRYDAPDRSVTDVGAGDYVKIGSSWRQIRSNSAEGAERLPHHHALVITDESGIEHSMMGVNRYAKAEDMEAR